MFSALPEFFNVSLLELERTLLCYLCIVQFTLLGKGHRFTDRRSKSLERKTVGGHALTLHRTVHLTGLRAGKTRVETF